MGVINNIYLIYEEKQVKKHLFIYNYVPLFPVEQRRKE